MQQWHLNQLLRIQLQSTAAQRCAVQNAAVAQSEAVVCTLGILYTIAPTSGTSCQVVWAKQPLGSLARKSWLRMAVLCSWAFSALWAFLYARQWQSSLKMLSQCWMACWPTTIAGKLSPHMQTCLLEQARLLICSQAAKQWPASQSSE